MGESWFGQISTAGPPEVLLSTFVSACVVVVVVVRVEPGIGGATTVLALSFKFGLGRRRGRRLW